jgi:hypothetical protein
LLNKGIVTIKASLSALETNFGRIPQKSDSSQVSITNGMAPERCRDLVKSQTSLLGALVIIAIRR